MTLRGFFVIIIGIFSMVLAMGTEIKEFYIMALCVCGVILYSFLSIVLASLTLNVKSKMNKTAAIHGESIKYRLFFGGFIILPVAGYLSVKGVNVDLKSKSRKKHTFLMLPSFFIKRKFAFELPCAHIGRWKVGIGKLRFEDLFGLFSLPLLRSVKKDFESELSVVPRKHTIEESIENTSTGGFGNSSSSSAEEGELLGDSRLYREGDSLKRINWKQSARAKKLYSRQYEMLQKPKIVIAVDCAFTSTKMWDAADISFETAVSLSNYFIEELNEVELLALRLNNGESTKNIELKSVNDVTKMQYEFWNEEYCKTKQSLSVENIDEKHILKADKIFFITDSISPSFLLWVKEMNKNGKYVRCVLAKTEPSQEDFDLEQSEKFIMILSSADEISKKAGAIL